MHCWARYLFYAVVTVLAIGQMMVACGQTGDLYLPDDKAARPAPQATPTATEPSAMGPDGEGLEAVEDLPNATPGPVSPQAEGL